MKRGYADGNVPSILLIESGTQGDLMPLRTDTSLPQIQMQWKCFEKHEIEAILVEKNEFSSSWLIKVLPNILQSYHF